MGYAIRFTGTPFKFDHVEIATYTGSSYVNYLTQLDNIDLNWATEPFQDGFTSGWTFSGNAALESRADAVGRVMVLKRNDGSDRFDMIATPTRAMASGFTENYKGAIEFWAKSVRESNGPFQLLNLYQRSGTYPNFFRLAVDSSDNIVMNWSTSYIDTGADWIDAVWHRVRVDVYISGAAWGSYINVTYDGRLILTNHRVEDAWQQVNNASFELSPAFAGQLLIDGLNIDLDPAPRSDDFDLFLKTPVIQAGPAGAKSSTIVKDVQASNPDEDPCVEIQLAFTTLKGTKGVPGYHKLVYNNGKMEFEGNYYPFERTETTYACRIIEGPIKENRTRYLILGANFYWGGSYTKYYHCLSVMDLLPEKRDRGSLATDDAALLPVIASLDTMTMEYVDMKAADVDLDGRKEIVLLSNDVIDPMHPFTLQVYRKMGGQILLVTSQRISIPPAFGGFGFSMRDMLIKDIDSDGILEVVITGAVYDGAYNKWGASYMLQYNTNRRFDSDPFFVNNTINGCDPFNAVFPFFPYRFQDSVGGAAAYYYTEFLALDAMDLDYDGIDEIVCAGHYFVNGFERPGFVIMDFDGTKYVATANTRTYRNYHNYLYGRISTVKIFDIDNNGNYEIFTGGNSTNFTASLSPWNHADMRMMEVNRVGMAITDRRMAVWMYYSTGTPTSYWHTYPFSGLPGYTTSYSSSITDLEVTDLDFDGTPEICTIGTYITSPLSSAYNYGATHTMRWDGADFVLRYRNVFIDSNNYRTNYLDMDIENVDYDLLQEMFIGGMTSVNQERNHDLSAVVNPFSNSSQTYNVAEGYVANDIDHIVINEFFTGTPDAVEFYNQGPTKVMTGWTIPMYDNNVYSMTYTFPAGFTLASGAFVVVHEEAGNNSATDLYAGAGFNFPWASRPMAVGLVDSSGNCVDWFQSNGYTGPTPAGVVWTQDN
jgi:hypothetical protein